MNSTFLKKIPEKLLRWYRTCFPSEFKVDLSKEADICDIRRILNTKLTDDAMHPLLMIFIGIIEKISVTSNPIALRVKDKELRILVNGKTGEISFYDNFNHIEGLSSSIERINSFVSITSSSSSILDLFVIARTAKKQINALPNFRFEEHSISEDYSQKFLEIYTKRNMWDEYEYIRMSDLTPANDNVEYTYVPDENEKPLKEDEKNIVYLRMGHFVTQAICALLSTQEEVTARIMKKLTKQTGVAIKITYVDSTGSHIAEYEREA